MNDGLEYAAYETLTTTYKVMVHWVLRQYGKISLSAVIGNGLGVVDKCASPVCSPVSQYIFKVKSRNPSDTLHAVSSNRLFPLRLKYPTLPRLLL